MVDKNGWCPREAELKSEGRSSGTIFKVAARLSPEPLFLEGFRWRGGHGWAGFFIGLFITSTILKMQTKPW